MLTQTLSSRVYTLRHWNARGCECGRRETSVQCCSNDGQRVIGGIGLASRGGVCPIHVYPP